MEESSYRDHVMGTASWASGEGDCITEEMVNYGNRLVGAMSCCRDGII